MPTRSLIRRSAIILVVFTMALAAYGLSGRPGGTTFASGSFNLKIDSFAIYNGAVVPSATWGLRNLIPGSDKFFDIADVKPGDSGENTISLHVNEDAWMCLAFSNLTNKENGQNEPEALVDPTPHSNSGELTAGMEFFAWHDDGDNAFEVGEAPIFGTSTQSAAVLLNETTYVLADSSGGTPSSASSTKHIGITWCAGDLTVNLATAAIACDGAALGNAAQTDSMSVDVSLRAVPVSEQPSFRCDGTADDGGGSQGMGEQIGLFVKCQVIAQYSWPLPKYVTECPNGFGSNGAASPTTQTVQPRRSRTSAPTTTTTPAPEQARTNSRSR